MDRYRPFSPCVCGAPCAPSGVNPDRNPANSIIQLRIIASLVEASERLLFHLPLAICSSPPLFYSILTAISFCLFTFKSFSVDFSASVRLINQRARTISFSSAPCPPPSSSILPHLIIKRKEKNSNGGIRSCAANLYRSTTKSKVFSIIVTFCYIIVVSTFPGLFFSDSTTKRTDSFCWREGGGP